MTEGKSGQSKTDAIAASVARVAEEEAEEHRAEEIGRRTRMRAPTKATGGGGYTFADKVDAGFLAQMLKRAFPIEPEFGPITEVHFETRDSGQILDDLLVVLKRGNELTRCAISVKSNRQLTKAGFNDEFVGDAWEQWEGAVDSTFNRETDLLGLVVGAIDNPILEEWRELQKQDFATTPERMVQRLSDSHQSSAAQRAIFESLRKARNAVNPDPLETARLASRIRVLPFLEGEEGRYINLSAEIVLDASLQEGTKLWSRLIQLAAENRGTGGYFDLSKLLRTLRPDFELRDYPDFEADWKRIEAVSSAYAKGTRSVIGKNIHLPRIDERNAISASVVGHNVVVVVGESGSGKSALVSQLIADGGKFKRILWLSAGQLSKPSQAELAHGFNLRNSIPELIHISSLSGCVVVIDGFEKLEGDARRRALELITAVKSEGFIGWKLIITCQTQSSRSAQDALIEAGITESHRVDFEKPNAQEIYNAIPHLPEIRGLLARSHLQPILRNLVMLDWVLRAEIPNHLTDTLSKPDIGRGLHQTIHIIRTRASGYPSWPGVSDSTQGRIHWRRPTAIDHFSLATLRRTYIRYTSGINLRRKYPIGDWTNLMAKFQLDIKQACSL